jgi:hypothetical protein
MRLTDERQFLSQSCSRGSAGFPKGVAEGCEDVLE